MTPEGAVKSEILKHLAGIHASDKSVWYRVIPVTKMPSGYRKSPLVGLPDILVVVDGKTCWIETKDPAKGDPVFSESQKPVASELVEAGCEICLTNNVPQAVAFIARMRAKYGKRGYSHPMDAR
jgi:hypothetical protein